MSLLIFTLPLAPADKAALLDCVQSADGRSVTRHTQATLALLPAPDRQAEVVAVVPLQMLSWHRTQLPPGSLPRSLKGERSKRLRSILDGLLEDQLLDDPAQLHLALQPLPQVSLPLWLAACDKTWLSAALALLTQAGHKVTRIVPESSPEALREAIEVTGEVDFAWVAGLVGLRSPADAPATPGVLMCALSATAIGLLPTDTPVLAEPPVAALAEQLFQRPITLQQRGERLLQAAHTPWDLSQFEFTHAQRTPGWTALTRGWQSFIHASQWRAGRWALVVLLIGNVVGLNVWAWREQSNLKAQRQKVRAVLTETFPKVAVVIDAPLQMTREIAALQRAHGSAVGTDMESILAVFSALAPAEYKLTAIDYVANEARLTGPALAANEQARITTGLQALGLRVSTQGTQWVVRAGGTP